MMHATVKAITKVDKRLSALCTNTVGQNGSQQINMPKWQSDGIMWPGRYYPWVSSSG